MWQSLHPLYKPSASPTIEIRRFYFPMWAAEMIYELFNGHRNTGTIRLQREKIRRKAFFNHVDSCLNIFLRTNVPHTKLCPKSSVRPYQTTMVPILCVLTGRKRVRREYSFWSLSKGNLLQLFLTTWSTTLLALIKKLLIYDELIWFRRSDPPIERHTHAHRGV